MENVIYWVRGFVDGVKVCLVSYCADVVWRGSASIVILVFLDGGSWSRSYVVLVWFPYLDALCIVFGVLWWRWV